MNGKTIALDVESTIADINKLFREEYYERTGVEVGEWNHWGFADSQHTMKEFMEITSSNWKNRVEDIPPTEKALMPKVHQLNKLSERLDVVTGRQGFDRQIKAWLDTQGVVYDNYRVVSSQTQKTKLGYDILIDDSPEHEKHLNDSQLLFLYDQPYNQNVAETDNVIRVNSLTEVISYLT